MRLGPLSIILFILNRKDLCTTQPQSQTLARWQHRAAPACPRQAHSPSQYTGTYGYCINFAVISPSDICARPGRRCPHFILQGRYSEVLAKICTHGRRPENTIDCVTAAAWLSCELPHRHRPKPPRARLRNRWDGRGRYAPNLQRRRQIPLPRRPHGSDLPPLGR